MEHRDVNQERIKYIYETYKTDEWCISRLKCQSLKDLSCKVHNADNHDEQKLMGL